MKFSRIGKRLMQVACALPLLCVLAACSSGGDGGGGGTAPAAAPSVGVFIDSPVQGLGYTCVPSGLSGLTNASGQYNYLPGDTVTFNLYGRTIGAAVPAGPVVTALSVFNATSLTDPQVVNLSQLLLTLSGGAPAPGNPIVLPANAPANFPATIDFTAAGFDTSFQGLTLVSEATATTHLQANFSTLSVTLAGAGSVISNPAGINCGATCSADFSNGTAVTLTATGAGFTGWSGGCTGAGACVVTLNANTAVTATFIAVPVNTNLTVTKAGNGTGTVTSSPAGIDCGATCSASLVQGTVVLTATAANGSTFASWSNGTGNANCTGTGTCSIPLTVDSTVIATFTLNAVPVSVTANVASGNGGSGTILCSANGGGALPCGSYLPGTAMVLTATPDSVSNFTGWSGAGCSGTGTCSFTVTSATTVTANFNRPVLTVQVVGTGSVSSNPAGIDTCSTNCSAPFNKGAVTLTASGTGFTSWSGGGCLGTGACLVTLDQNTTVTATFGGGGVSTSARYHFFTNAGGFPPSAVGLLMAVDPAAPAATPTTVATGVTKTILLYSSTWDAPTTSLTNLLPVFQIYASNGRLWRVNVAKSSGVPGSASNPPVQISNESAATQVCTFDVVFDGTNPNTRRMFYELPGADGLCGFFGLGGTNADNITKFVSVSDGAAVAPSVLPTGLTLPHDRSFVRDLSSGIATHTFLTDAAASNTLKIMNLATQAITPIQANIEDIRFIAQDTSNRVFVESFPASTIYVYTVSSNTLVPLLTGASLQAGASSDGTNFFATDSTAGIIYRIPLTATAAGQVTPILNVGGPTSAHVATTNRVYVLVPTSNGPSIISVPKTGGASRVDVPSVGDQLIYPLLVSANGLFYYTQFDPFTISNPTTGVLSDSGTTVSSFPNTTLAGAGAIALPRYNPRGPVLSPSKVLMSTLVGSTLNGGTMTAIEATTGLPVTNLGTVPATTPDLVSSPATFFFSDVVDSASLGFGLLSGNAMIFFLDTAIPNSLVQVPVAPGQWWLSYAAP
ncbi:MAG: hypothetical protein AAB433_22070 [Nitrospirota bacterium]